MSSYSSVWIGPFQTCSSYESTEIQSIVLTDKAPRDNAHNINECYLVIQFFPVYMDLLAPPLTLIVSPLFLPFIIPYKNHNIIIKHLKRVWQSQDDAPYGKPLHLTWKKLSYLCKSQSCYKELPFFPQI